MPKTSRADLMRRRRGRAILLCMLGLAAAIIFGLGHYIGKFKAQLNADADTRLEEAAQYAAEHITTVIRETQKKMRTIAAALAAMDNVDQKMRYLRRAAADAGFVYLGYAGEDAMLHATIASESGDVGNEAYYREAMRGKPAISDYIRKIFHSSAARGILLSVPIYDPGPERRPIGVLLAMLDARRLREALTLPIFGGAGYAYVVNREGMVIMRTRSLDFDNIFLAWKDRAFAPGHSLARMREEMEKGVNGMAIFANAAGAPQYVYHYTLPFNEWTLISMVPEEAVAGSHKALIREATVFGGMMALIFTALIAYAWYSWWLAWRSQAQSEAKTKFLSSMSHEIRTPLNGIIGLNHLMRAHIGDPAKMEGYLEQSQATARYLLDLINDILDINKLDADKMELVSKPFNLVELAEGVSAVFSASMAEKGIEFIVNVAADKPMLLGDEVRLRQILTNIIGNAQKFTPVGGRVSFDIGQTAVGDGESLVRFVVADTGRGMSAEFQKRVFDAFSQERQITDGAQGTGLGMAISAQLAKK